MLSRYQILDFAELGDTETYLSPDIPILSLDSPAGLFMTDFLTIHPVVVCETTNVDDALGIMKQSCVRLLLVHGHTDQTFRGMITASDINGGKVLAYMSTHQIQHRNEVEVRHIMKTRADIHAFLYDDLREACIGDVILTIKNLGEQHILVMEESDGKQIVRGMYSTTDIAKALRVEFDVEPHARTFFELEQAILHHDVA
jgi:CBS domain containing-hemolysin-like protein